MANLLVNISKCCHFDCVKINSKNTLLIGSIREAGGKFGEIEQAQEEAFFRKLQQEQLKKIQKTKPEDGDTTKEKDVKNFKQDTNK